MVSALAPPDQVARQVGALAGDIVFLGKTRLSQCRSPPRRANGKFNAGGKPAMDQQPIQGGVDTLLVASCQRNRRRPDGIIESYADFVSACLSQLLNFCVCSQFSLKVNWSLRERRPEVKWTKTGNMSILLTVVRRIYIIPPCTVLDSLSTEVHFFATSLFVIFLQPQPLACVSHAPD